MKKESSSATSLVVVFATIAVLLIFILLSKYYEVKYDFKYGDPNAKVASSEVGNYGYDRTDSSNKDRWIIIGTLVMAFASIVTMIATRRMADTSGDQLDLYKRQVALDLRALLYPTGQSNVIKNAIDGWGMRAIWCEFWLNNSGKSPATGVNVKWTLEVVHREYNEWWKWQSRFRENRYPDIGPSQTFAIIGTYWKNEQTDYKIFVDDIDKMLVFWGEISWRDGDGPHSTRFYYNYLKSGNATGKEQFMWFQPEDDGVGSKT